MNINPVRLTTFVAIYRHHANVSGGLVEAALRRDGARGLNLNSPRVLATMRALDIDATETALDAYLTGSMTYSA